MTSNAQDNPFPFGSTLFWLLETPVESEFRKYEAVIQNAGFENHSGLQIYVMNIDATKSTGAYYALGGIQPPFADAAIRDALDVFETNSLETLSGRKCTLCLWHGRSVAVENPSNGRIHFPESVVKEENLPKVIGRK